MSTKTFEDFKDEVRSSTPIEDVFVRYAPNTQPKHRGNVSWNSFCPIKPDHRSGRTVDLDSAKGLWHCKACNVGGDAFNLVMQVKELDFVDAVNDLAQTFGFQGYEKTGKPVTEPEVLNAIEDFVKVCNKLLLKELQSGKSKVKKYLKGRDISIETVDAYSLGFLPEGYDGFDRSQKRLLQVAGLYDYSKRSNKGYFPLANRLIFPISDWRDDRKVFVSASGRVIDDVKCVYPDRKYINTRNTIVYQKSRCFFGLGEVFDDKSKGDLSEIVISEGQLDVTALRQRGNASAIGLCGSALSGTHAQRITSLDVPIVLMTDSDRSGYGSMIKTVGKLKDSEQEIRIVRLPKGTDPDSLSKKKLVKALRSSSPAADALPEICLSYIKEDRKNPKKPIKKKEVEKVLEMAELPKHEEDLLLRGMMQRSSDITLDTVQALSSRKAKQKLKDSVDKPNFQHPVYSWFSFINGFNQELIEIISETQTKKTKKFLKEALSRLDDEAWPMFSNLLFGTDLPVDRKLFAKITLANKPSTKASLKGFNSALVSALTLLVSSVDNVSDIDTISRNQLHDLKKIGTSDGDLVKATVNFFVILDRIDKL